MEPGVLFPSPMHDSVARSAVWQEIPATVHELGSGAAGSQ